jgi:NAD(P)-dependent dehydrogenase (short-subunit alcohol dehydrogenase family)
MSVLLVTGGSRGIGAAIAKLAARKGYDVCVNYVRARERADQVAAAVHAEGRRAHRVPAGARREVIGREPKRLGHPQVTAPSGIARNPGRDSNRQPTTGSLLSRVVFRAVQAIRPRRL